MLKFGLHGLAIALAALLSGCIYVPLAMKEQPPAIVQGAHSLQADETLFRISLWRVEHDECKGELRFKDATLVRAESLEHLVSMTPQHYNFFYINILGEPTDIVAKELLAIYIFTLDGKSYMVQQRGDSFLDEPWDITHEGVVGDDWMERLLKIRRKELISVSGGLSALFPTPSEYDSYLGYCTRSHNNGESRKGFESNPHAVWASDTADLIEFTHLLNRKKIPGDADEIQDLWHVLNKRN